MCELPKCINKGNMKRELEMGQQERKVAKKASYVKRILIYCIKYGT